MRRRRARDVVLWGLAAVCALQLGLRAAIEARLGRCRDPFYEDMMVRLRPRWRDRAGGGPEAPQRLAVMLGSSRTGYGLRGDVAAAELTAALGERWAVSGLAALGAGPLMQRVNCRRLFAEGVRPDLLLVEVAPLLLAGEAPEEHWIKAERLTRAEIELLAECGMPAAAELRAEWWRGWACPWYTHRFAILSATLPNFVPGELQLNWAARGDRTGWVPLPADRGITPAQARAARETLRRRYEARWRDCDLAASGCRALRAVLAECRRRDVPAVLVLMPESAALRSWFGPASQARLDAFLAELRAGDGVPVLDARAWVADDGFADDLHLHTGGAAVLSRRLGRTLAALLRAAPTVPEAPAGELPVGAAERGAAD